MTPHYSAWHRHTIQHDITSLQCVTPPHYSAWPRDCTASSKHHGVQWCMLVSALTTLSIHYRCAIVILPTYRLIYLTVAHRGGGTVAFPHYPPSSSFNTKCVFKPHLIIRDRTYLLAMLPDPFGRWPFLSQTLSCATVTLPSCYQISDTREHIAGNVTFMLSLLLYTDIAVNLQ